MLATTNQTPFICGHGNLHLPPSLVGFKLWWHADNAFLAMNRKETGNYGTKASTKQLCRWILRGRGECDVAPSTAGPADFVGADNPACFTSSWPFLTWQDGRLPLVSTESIILTQMSPSSHMESRRGIWRLKTAAYVKWEQSYRRPQHYSYWVLDLTESINRRNCFLSKKIGVGCGRIESKWKLWRDVLCFLFRKSPGFCCFTIWGVF